MRDGTDDPDWPIPDDEAGSASGLTGSWPTEDWLAGDPPSARRAVWEQPELDWTDPDDPDPAEQRGAVGRRTAGRSTAGLGAGGWRMVGRSAVGRSAGGTRGGASGRARYGRMDLDALDSDLRGYRGPGSRSASEPDLDPIYPDVRDLDLMDPDSMDPELMGLDALGLDVADATDLAASGSAAFGPDVAGQSPGADPGVAGIRRARSRWKGADATGPDEWFGGEEAARAACLRLLTTAPRTRAQLATALRRRGVPEQIAESVLARFTEVGLIDDAAFAYAWVESRHHSKGLARRALAAELRQRGVSAGEVREAVGSLGPQDEIEAARQLVSKRLPASRGRPLPTRARQLLGMLARKGYPAGLAAQVVREALEQEETGNPDLAHISEDTAAEGWL